MDSLPEEVQDLVSSHLDRASLVALAEAGCAGMARRGLAQQRRRDLEGLRDRTLAAARVMHTQRRVMHDLVALRLRYRGQMCMDGGLMRYGFQLRVYDEPRRHMVRLYAGHRGVHIAYVHGGAVPEDALAAVRGALEAAAHEADAAVPPVHVAGVLTPM